MLSWSEHERSQNVFSSATISYFFSSIPFILFAFLFFLPRRRNSDHPFIVSHSGLFAPLPATVRALHFYREKDSALSSLVDSRLIVKLIMFGLFRKCCVHHRSSYYSNSGRGSGSSGT